MSQSGGADGGPSHHGDGGGNNEFTDAMVCDQSAPIMVTKVTKIPDMLLVVDESGSMDQALDPSGAGPSKWQVMHTGLDTVLTAKNADINFGLTLFPSDGQCGAGTINVPVMPMNAPAIQAQLAGVAPGGATPTYIALQGALQYYQGVTPNPDGRFVLLATDGEPNCAGNGADPGGQTISESVAAIQALAAAGIKTFVIGFGSDITADPTTLMSFATAGQTMMYYPANSPDQLNMALAAISGSITSASCTYTLATMPQDITKLTVKVGGMTIPLDHSHTMGWDYDPGTNSITFYGSTCDQIQTGTLTDVSIDYGCGGPVIG